MRLDEIDQPNKKVVFTFGRLNPPHYGHGGLIKTLQLVAKQKAAHWYLFVSSKNEPEKNPLTYEQKCHWIRILFPEVEGHLVIDPSIKTPLVAATWLYKQGFRSATFVAGEDDMESYSQMIKSGNEHGRKNPDALRMGKGFYFEPLEFDISARLASATNSRSAVTNNDPEAFARSILGPKITNPQLLKAVAKDMFPMVRKGMQLESINEDADEDERRAFMMRPENQKDTPISNALKNYTPLGDMGKIGSAVNKGEYGKALLPAAQLATNLIPGKAVASAASTAIGAARGIADESEELNKRTPSVRELAHKYMTTPAAVHRALARGIKVEFEHTDDIEVATEIAMDHIGEKLDYYTRLAKVEENFADGKGPGKPGDSQRHGIPKKASIAQLEKASHADGRKGQLARWQMNMRRGKKKANEEITESPKMRPFQIVGGYGFETQIHKFEAPSQADAERYAEKWAVQNVDLIPGKAKHYFVRPITKFVQQPSYWTTLGDSIEEEKKPKKPKTIIDGALKTLIAKGRSEDEAIADLKKEIDSKFYDLTETREGALNWLKSYLPSWPEYVLRDWLYRGLTAKEHNPPEHPKEVVDRSIAGEGMSAQTQWKLIPNFEFKMEKLHPDTQRRINIRAGGSANPMKVPKDAERHATQAALAQQQGGVRKEPVIGKMTPQGFELIEGWHRTIQHFNQFPDGYSGPAWVAMNAKNESVSEVAKVKLSTEPDNFGAWVNDSGKPEKTVVIPTNKIHVFEPDDKFDNPQHAKNLANIVKAIKAGKKLPPILVRRHGIDRFQVVDGHHRFMAYRMAGVKNIPARVVDPKNITGNVEEATDYSRGEELEGIDIMGAPVFITHHAIERLDRKGERSVDVEEIYEIIEKAVRQHGRDIANLHNTDFALKGENGPPREPKNGFGIALAKTEDSTGNTVYVIKTLHPTLLIGRMPGFKVQGLKRRYSIYEDAADESTKPRVYLDMDGVLADFFGEWAKLSGVDHYKDINNVEAQLQMVRDHPTFWIDLPMLPHAKALIQTVVKNYGEYRICSKPLEGDTRSEPGKLQWIKKHLSGMPPVEVILTADKAKFAKNDGYPNILVDDYGVNINSWRAAGGIGIKYDDQLFEHAAKVLQSLARSGVSK